MKFAGLVALAVLSAAAGAEAAEHEGLGAVRQRGYLRVCADPSNPPFTSDDSVTPGFEVELARLVARELGVDARFQWNLTYRRALRPLREGACDLFMGLPRDERFGEGNPWIAVSQPYYVMSHAIVARREGAIRSVGDLTGKRVAVQGTGIADFHLFERGIERGIYRTQEEAFAAVASGEAGAALLWLPVASWLARGKPDLRVVPVSAPKLDFPVGAGVRRRERDLAAAVDAAIGRLKASGKTQEVLARYGAIPGPRAMLLPSWIVRVQAKDPIERGRALFSTACSRCHGAEGTGAGEGGSIPILRNYEGGQDRFTRFVREGRKSTAMAAFKSILTDEEISALYRYLTSLPRQ